MLVAFVLAQPELVEKLERLGAETAREAVLELEVELEVVLVEFGGRAGK